MCEALDNSTRSMTDEEVRRVVNSPVLALPYVFANGSAMQGLSIACSKCGQHLEGEQLKGEFVAYNDESAALDGYGVCEACKLINPFNIKVRNDGTMLVKMTDGWRESRYAEAEAPSFLGRLWQLICGTGFGSGA